MKLILEKQISLNPLLSVFSSETQKAIARSSVVRRYERGQALAREMEESDRFILLLRGRVDICRNSEEGTLTTFRSLYPPAGIGYLLLSGQPHTADVIAGDTRVTTALIPVLLLRKLLSDRPEGLFRAVTSLAGLVDELSTEIIETRTLSLLQRVRLTLLRNADSDGEFRGSHEDLAAMIGASRAKVSRALTALESAGEVSLSRRCIRIMNRV